MVYVLNIEGKPLMPTERHGKVRRMLRDGLAHVVRLSPFTIQLNYESSDFTQDVSLGIDAGSQHIGISATTEKRELLAMQVEERDDVVELLATRREARRTRRSRKLRYRPPRFDNRRRKEGWMTPSVENKINAHLCVMRIMHAILPIAKTTIEVAQFDTQKIKNDTIAGVEYQQGEQLGFWNVREYVIARDGHKCQHCKGKSKDPILNVHHIESRKTGGNAPNNLVTLCETCHKAHHRGEFELKLKCGTNLRDAAVMSIMRWEVYNRAKQEFPNVNLTYGYVTKHSRINNKIEKTHCADALCISGNMQAIRLPFFFIGKMLRRHTRSLHKSKPAKGGIRCSQVAPHWIGKSRLQQHDYVEWEGHKAFISGSSNGRLYLKDIQGNFVARYDNGNKKTVNAFSVKFLRRKRGGMIIGMLRQNGTMS